MPSTPTSVWRGLTATSSAAAPDLRAQRPPARVYGIRHRVLTNLLHRSEAGFCTMPACGHMAILWQRDCASLLWQPVPCQCALLCSSRCGCTTVAASCENSRQQADTQAEQQVNALTTQPHTANPFMARSSCGMFAACENSSMGIVSAESGCQTVHVWAESCLDSGGLWPAAVHSAAEECPCAPAKLRNQKR